MQHAAEADMGSKRMKFWSYDNRFRLMLTLGLAILLPAAALIYVNFHHVKSIKRDKKVEALIHRDFQYALAASEKRLNRKAYTMTEELRGLFPSPDTDVQADLEKQLDFILSKSPWLAHVFLWDREKGFLFRSRPEQMGDKYYRAEHEMMSEAYKGWFGMEGKLLVDLLHKKSRPISWYSGQTKRAEGETFVTTA